MAAFGRAHGKYFRAGPPPKQLHQCVSVVSLTHAHASFPAAAVRAFARAPVGLLAATNVRCRTDPLEEREDNETISE